MGNSQDSSEPVAWVECDGELVWNNKKAAIGRNLYTAPPRRTMVPLTEEEMYAVEEEARKNFRLSQQGPRGQQITYWDGLTPWLIRAVEKASWEKNHG